MPTRTLKEATQVADTELGEKLREVNVPFQPYKSPPLSKDIAALAIVGGVIRFWPGAADLKVSDPDPTHRQVVLTVDETDRTITRKYDLRIAGQWNGNTDRQIREYFLEKQNFTQPVKVLMERLAREHFPVNVPNRKFVSYVFTDVKYRGAQRVNTSGRTDFGFSVASFTVTTTVSAPGAKQSFLIGIDETAPFIAPLPKQAKTVSAAHDALRPAGVKKGTLRQGEFFFVPATKTELKEIDQRLRRFDGSRVNIWQNGVYRGMGFRPLEDGSSHHAMTISVGSTRFATGPVVDTRSDHHAPLYLEGWYKVVRNAEVTVSPATRPGPMFERRRTWD